MNRLLSVKMLVSSIVAGILMFIGYWIGNPYADYFHYPGLIAYLVVGALLFFTDRGDAFEAPGEWFPIVAGLLLWTVIIYSVISFIEFVVQLEEVRKPTDPPKKSFGIRCRNEDGRISRHKPANHR